MFGEIIFWVLIVLVLGALWLCWWVDNAPKKKPKDDEKTKDVSDISDKEHLRQ